MAVSIPGQYEYREILAKDYIRILTLYPASELNAPLCGELDQAPLEPESSYATISYSWGMNADGDATLNRIIYISGRPLAITQNLFEGLKRIRHLEVPRRLWVDAICINQGATLERNAQVSQMAKIFSCSNHLIIWHGEGESEDDDNLILRVASYDLEQCTLNNEDGGICCYTTSHNPHYIRFNGEIVNFHEIMHVLQVINSSYIHMGKFAKAIDDALESTDVHPLVVRSVRKTIQIALKFFLRRYWRRRWIAQQLYHSRTCTIEVRWGACQSENLWQMMEGPLWQVLKAADCLVLDRDIASMRDIVKELASPIDDAVLTGLAISAIQALMSSTAHITFDDFIGVLVALACTKCSDDRDQLFALSSLSPGYAIEPDYSMTTTQVYLNFAYQFIKRGRLTTLLTSFGDEPSEGDEVLDLPSWVPDLRSTYLDLTDITKIEDDDPILLDGDIIVFKAYYLGTIEATSSGIGETANTPHSIIYCDQQRRSVSCPMPETCNRKGSPKHGDYIFVLFYRHVNSTLEDVDKLALVLRKQLRTYNGQNVYRQVAFFFDPLDELGHQYVFGPETTICMA